MAVNQRTKSDCGIAAVANAAGKSYKAVKEAFGECRGGISQHEMGWLIGLFSEYKKIVCRGAKIDIETWATRHPAGRFVVCLDVFLDSHAIAVVDGKILGHYSGKWPVSYYFKLQ